MPKRASESATEMVQVVLPNDANPLGYILGGTVMHLIDIAGAIACHRHTRSLLVTAAVDGLQFLHPIKVGDLILLKAHVTAAWSTSLEVEVEVFSEEILTGLRRLTSVAYLTFVVDTGGELISISQATAGQMTVANPYRRIPLKVYGTSGWDKDAFLMPNVDLEFNSIRFSKIPVVVLNLRAPSALLGFQLGGIVGHKFLSKYRVSIDLVRSVVGLDSN